MSATTRVVIRGGNGLRMAVDLPDAGSPVDAVTWALESFRQFDQSYEPDKLVIVAQVGGGSRPARHGRHQRGAAGALRASGR